MELERIEEFTHSGKVAYSAQGQAIEVTGDQWLEIMVCDPSRTIFSQGPPKGKRWDVYINMSVVEHNE